MNRGARIRYADNTYTEDGPTGVPNVITNTRFSRNVRLIPEKYGKMNEIGGWEFENFNQVYNNFLQNVKT
jgi:hypothetical protein